MLSAKWEMLKMHFRHIILIVLLSIYGLSKENKVLESQPEILFEYKNLNKVQNEIALQVKFNNAVLYLEQEKYVKAIKLFKQTQKLLKIPSFLNIGIAYFKLNSQNNAYLYLKKIYDVKEVASEDPYSYMSASYYLFKLTNDKKFMEDIIKLASKKKRLNEYTKRLVVDVYIELEQYAKALAVLKDMKYPLDLKIALLYIKLKKYDKALKYLDKSLKIATDDNLTNKILWIKVFADLKSNSLSRLENDISLIIKRKRIYHTHIEMPIKLYFNKNRFMAKEYFDMITKFDVNRKIDFIFYFAPYIFTDNDAIKLEENKAFILKNNENFEDLDIMMNYNKEFIKIIKQDPIHRATQLQNMLDKKYDTQPYEYYNLGLSYAQIDDFNKAHKYFKKAYNLTKGNKLYAAMTLISAKRIKIRIPKNDKEKIIKNLLSKSGIYHYFGQYIYKVIYDTSYIPKEETLTTKFKKSIFFRALYFLDAVDKKGILRNEPLLVEFDKDPLVYMLNLIARNESESDYQYISRIQDNMPTKLNNIFIKGPLIITRFYLDILKAMGMLHVADLNIDIDTSATYYRTKALVQLYNGNPKSTISIIEHLQKEYNLEDRYTYFLLIAAMIETGDVENAFITLTLAQQLLTHDVDVEFLIGLKLLQDFKIGSSMQYLQNKYSGDLIDFKLEGLDKLLKEL